QSRFRMPCLSRGNFFVGCVFPGSSGVSRLHVRDSFEHFENRLCAPKASSAKYCLFHFVNYIIFPRKTFSIYPTNSRRCQSWHLLFSTTPEPEQLELKLRPLRQPL